MINKILHQLPSATAFIRKTLYAIAKPEIVHYAYVFDVPISKR